MAYGWVLVTVSIFVVVMTLLATAGRIAPNGLLGIRTPATQRDEVAWRRAHRAAAWLLVPGCAISIVVGVLFVLGPIALGGSADRAGEVACFCFAVLVGVAAFVADRAARRPPVPAS